MENTIHLSGLKLSFEGRSNWKLLIYAAVVAALVRDHVVPRRGLAISLRKRLSIEMAHADVGELWLRYSDTDRLVHAERFHATAKRIAEKSVKILEKAPERGLDFELLQGMSFEEAQKFVMNWFQQLGIRSQEELFEVFGFARNRGA